MISGFWRALVVLSVAACGRGSAFSGDAGSKDTAGQSDAADSADSSGGDSTDGTDSVDSTDGADSGATESWVFTDLPSEWLEAPPGFCEQLAHQTVCQYVVDGDTIEVTNGGKVRFVGTNAAEIAHKAGELDQCHGLVGKEALELLVAPDKTVCLYADSGDAVDQYGRLLRYVYIQHNGKWVQLNHRTVRLGASRAYHSFLKGREFKIQIEQAELDARDEKIGGWDACGWTLE